MFDIYPTPQISGAFTEINLNKGRPEENKEKRRVGTGGGGPVGNK
jgi:hypothetical protein